MICAFWWSNHRLVATLDTISSRSVGVGLVMLGFVVLLAFTTGGLGDVDDRTSGEVAAVRYALNVAMVSLGLADTPVVFLLPIPIVSGPLWGRCSWLLLAVTGTLVGRLARRVAGGH